MIIWILLITFVVTCLAQLTFNARNEAMTKAAKQAMRQHGANSAPIAVIAWITSAALAGALDRLRRRRARLAVRRDRLDASRSQGPELDADQAFGADALTTDQHDGEGK